MADGFIVRKGGVTTEQALAPTITEVSTSESTIVFTLKNNDTESAVILFETNDEVPDENSIELAGGATSGNLTITGLTVSPAILYASANVVGKVKSNITERSFTFTVPVFTAATGGTTLEYDDGGKRYKSHTFLENGNFVVSTVGDNVDDRNKVDYLIIAGGGGGGRNQGGGGGAGGYRTTLGTSGANSSAESKVTVTASTFAVVVGSGGSGALGTEGTQTAAAVNGLNSEVQFGSTITATGGGRGGSQPSTNSDIGGSGGGGRLNQNGSAGTANQGSAGGSGSTDGSTFAAGGGGGGASAVGQNGSSSNGGNGGNGLVNLLRTGSNETRSGGGGGGVFVITAGVGGTGGGGNGGSATATNGQNGTTNTGGGGGGGAFPSSGATGDRNGGNGGSGIVVIRYEIATV